LGEFLRLEIELLTSHEEMREIHPFTVSAIADMVEGPPESVNNDGHELFGLMQMMRQAQFNVQAPADVGWANRLFQNLCQLHRVFAKLFYPKLVGADAEERCQVLKRERGCLMEMTELAKRLLLLEAAGHLGEHVIGAFADMAWQFAEHCSRYNNVVLNRAPAHSVLQLGQRIDQPYDLKRKCRRTANYLKTK
jgi:hypothetical protein